MILIKNADVYAPEHLGKKDLLIEGGVIGYIEDFIDEKKFPVIYRLWMHVETIFFLVL